MRVFELSSTQGIALDDVGNLKLIDIAKNTLIKLTVYRNGHNPTERVVYELGRFPTGQWRIFKVNVGIDGMLHFSYSDSKTVKKLAEELLNYLYLEYIERGSKDYISVDIMLHNGREVRYTMYESKK